MKSIASDLIAEFGAAGSIQQPPKYDSITGDVISTDAPVSVEYYREFYQPKELIPGKIEDGDAKLYIADNTKPPKDSIFTDSLGEKWNVVDSRQIEAQGEAIIFEVHIRQ